MIRAADQNKHRIVFLVGSPRSGTTWLAHILNSYRWAVYSHEPLSKLSLTHLQPILKRLKANGAVDANEVELVTREWSKAYPQCRRPPFFRKGFSKTPPGIMWMAWLAVRTLGRGSRWFTRWFSPHPNSKYELVVKEIGWSKHIQSIVQGLNPELIVIIRHPCAVVASLIRGQRLGIMPTEDRYRWLQDHRQLLQEVGVSESDILTTEACEFLALDWLAQNLAYQAALQASTRHRVVVYEDLCRDPVGVTRSLFGFLNWELDRQTLRFLEQSTQVDQLATWYAAMHSYFGIYKDSAKTSTSWETELSDAEKERVLGIAQRFPHFREYWPDQPPPSSIVDRPLHANC